MKVTVNTVTKTGKVNPRLVSAVKKLGLYDSYVVGDLVVEKDRSFLLRPGIVGDEIFLYYNANADESQRDAIVSKVVINGEYRGLHIKTRGSYSVCSRTDDSIALEFRE